MSREHVGGLVGRPGLERLETRLLLSADSFLDVPGVELPGVERGSVAWADYDNDGDLDVLLTGWTGSETVSKVVRNADGDLADIDAGLPLGTGPYRLVYASPYQKIFDLRPDWWARQEWGKPHWVDP